jgi:hypothetical protein
VTAQPQLTALIVLIVIIAGLLHAVWNAIAKHLDDRVMAFAMMGLFLTASGSLTVAVTGLPARTAAR